MCYFLYNFFFNFLCACLTRWSDDCEKNCLCIYIKVNVISLVNISLFSNNFFVFLFHFGFVYLLFVYDSSSFNCIYKHKGSYSSILRKKKVVKRHKIDKTKLHKMKFRFIAKRYKYWHHENSQKYTKTMPIKRFSRNHEKKYISVEISISKHLLMG